MTSSETQKSTTMNNGLSQRYDFELNYIKSVQKGGVSKEFISSEGGIRSGNSQCYSNIF
jgi:hypothetical protein